MVIERIEQVAKEAERRFGLPKLSDLPKTLDKFPDEKHLKAIKQVLEVAERVSRTAPELDKVISLIREINSMPTDKLDKLERVLKRIEKIMKTAPADLIGFLTSLKEE